MHTERLVCYMIKDTKDIIIEEAFRLFLSKNYEGVSISDISESTNLTKGALYHHFVNKEELFKAVIDKYMVFSPIETNFETISLKQFNELWLNNLKKIIDRLCGEKDELIPVNYLSLTADSFRHYPGFSEKLMEFIKAEMGKTKKVLKNAIKNGEIRPDIDINTVAAIHSSNILGFAGNVFRNHSIKVSIKSLKKQLDEFYRLLKA